jgi:aspartate/methionine/tyrosine aminotransferase
VILQQYPGHPIVGSPAEPDDLGAEVDDDTGPDRLLDEQGVGVVKVRDFFYPGPDGEKPERWADYVRMAMARNPEVVTAAMDRIVEFCQSPTTEPSVTEGASVRAGRRTGYL